MSMQSITNTWWHQLTSIHSQRAKINVVSSNLEICFFTLVCRIKKCGDFAVRFIGALAFRARLFIAAKLRTHALCIETRLVLVPPLKIKFIRGLWCWGYFDDDDTALFFVEEGDSFSSMFCEYFLYFSSDSWNVGSESRINVYWKKASAARQFKSYYRGTGYLLTAVWRWNAISSSSSLR